MIFIGVFQLSIDSFNLIILKKIDYLIIVEGNVEAKLVKHIMSEFISIEADIGISNAKGIDNVKYMIQVITTLIKLTKKIKAVGIIIDAERKNPKERFESIINSLRAQHGKKAVEILKEENPFMINVLGKRFIIFVSYIDYPYEIHAIEDYFVCILLETGKITKYELKKYKSGKEILEKKGINPLELLASEKEIRRKCFQELIDFLTILTSI